MGCNCNKNNIDLIEKIRNAKKTVTVVKKLWQSSKEETIENDVNDFTIG